jgi:hypothetical protein
MYSFFQERSNHNATCHLAFNYKCHVYPAALCSHDTSFILNYVLNHIWNTCTEYPYSVFDNLVCVVCVSVGVTLSQLSRGSLLWSLLLRALVEVALRAALPLSICVPLPPRWGMHAHLHAWLPLCARRIFF